MPEEHRRVGRSNEIVVPVWLPDTVLFPGNERRMQPREARGHWHENPRYFRSARPGARSW